MPASADAQTWVSFEEESATWCAVGLFGDSEEVETIRRTSEKEDGAS